MNDWPDRTCRFTVNTAFTVRGCCRSEVNAPGLSVKIHDLVIVLERCEMEELSGRKTYRLRANAVPVIWFRSNKDVFGLRIVEVHNLVVILKR